LRKLAVGGHVPRERATDFRGSRRNPGGPLRRRGVSTKTRWGRLRASRRGAPCRRCGTGGAGPLRCGPTLRATSSPGIGRAEPATPS